MNLEYLICIDDTDDIGTKGTGEIAEELAQMLLQQWGGHASLVSRHQLFVHPDIPYTSHNSAMCFRYQSPLAQLADIVALASEMLVAESAPAADPGLAVVAAPSWQQQQALIAFGLQAKRQVLTKSQAYDLAAAQQIHLSEHGGTGQGVIGAIAGLGLFLQGSDGRIKGQFNLGQSSPTAVVMTVAEIIATTGLDKVIDTAGGEIGANARIHLSGKVKAVRYQHANALLVVAVDGEFHNAGKSVLKGY
ncbi:DNA-binding protein [Shewanella sp. NIFS-20-20]|uniref:DNA-binding protein n=1 Tax=Shewanella sp. NIFS-20-20 TaxID=2853806 RepID=UPI001C473AC4|nr:DNA-binding protein [Shewanella sp. NIFS-20-20]MBV7316031.1 DNA-binding protein [Shewanella sp. NIFS-20-20]